MIGAAPVPVPPPIPTVINNIFAWVLSMFLISSILSIADCSPILGFAPAPSPSVSVAPNWIFDGTGLLFKA